MLMIEFNCLNLCSSGLYTSYLSTPCLEHLISMQKMAWNKYTEFVNYCQKSNLMNPRALESKMYIPTDYEHCANTMSHGVVIIPSILASEFLLWKAGNLYPTHRNYWNCKEKECISGSNSSHHTYAEYEFCSRAYSASLIGLFLVSTIYHWISWTQSQWKKHKHGGCSVRRPSLNKFFHICDRTTIYFFIAGSYSPWLMLHYINPSIMWLQWMIWVAAVFGTLYTFLFLERYKLLDTIFYIIVGIVPALLVYLTNTSDQHTNAIIELGVGGLFYCIGVLFFKCDGRIPFAHAIWHLFVVAGAYSHFITIYKHFYSFPV